MIRPLLQAGSIIVRANALETLAKHARKTLRVGDERADEAAWSLIDSWPKLDRGDLLWRLRLENLVE